MLGNLSKTVLKIPSFFNTNTKSIEKSAIHGERYPAINRKNIPQLKGGYFRERDFMLYEPLFTLNISNNKKLIYPKIITHKVKTFEEFLNPETNQMNNLGHSSSDKFTSRNKSMTYQRFLDKGKTFFCDNIKFNYTNKTFNKSRSLLNFKRRQLFGQTNNINKNFDYKTEDIISEKTFEKNLLKNLSFRDKSEENKRIIINNFNNNNSISKNSNNKKTQRSPVVISKFCKFKNRGVCQKSSDQLFQEYGDRKLNNLKLIEEKKKDNLINLQRSNVGRRIFERNFLNFKLNNQNNQPHRFKDFTIALPFVQTIKEALVENKY